VVWWGSGEPSWGQSSRDRPDGAGLEDVLAAFRPDLVVLDVMMPGRDGFTLTSVVRGYGDAGIVLLTARDGLQDRLHGLDGGADDYLVKPFELAELLSRFAAVLRRRGRLSHVTHTGARCLPLHADPTRLGQILSNLLNNARRHTPPGGQITVHLEHHPGLEDSHARLTVTDTGPGIPEPDRERIFNRLVRLDGARDRDTGGAGLGLSIARALAHAHHGTLLCLPTEHGARFQLTLPTTDSNHPTPSADTPRECACSRYGFRPVATLAVVRAPGQSKQHGR
jgi:signal transduction histidine kinase